MKRKSLLIVGCGDLGVRTGSLLLAEGWAVQGVRRNPDNLPAGFGAIGGDYTLAHGLNALREMQPDMVLATYNPVDRSLAGYRAGFADGARNLVAALAGHRPRRILFVSSTRVFAENHGGWVDEASPLTDTDERALAIIEAEQVLRAAGHAVSIVRFAGIYGHHGGRLVARLARGELSPVEPARWSNRIHRDDCAGFLAHLLRTALAGEALEPVYIGVDDCPTLHYEVERWLARELDVGVEGPEPEAVTASGKRCRNLALRASGYELRYPDYRSGYQAVLAASRD
jgi:nucleoside-diphosphate-sugar epimerase